MPSDSTVTVLVKLLIVGLVAVTLVLAVGVFVTGLLDPRFQVAFASD